MFRALPTPPVTFRFLLLLLIALPFSAKRVEAQLAPFETLSLTVAGHVDLGGGLDGSGYHDLWTPGPGLALRISTPFYLGTAQAGLQFSLHEGADDLPGYLAMLGYGGLGPTVRLPGGVEVEPAVLAGILSMDFYEDEDVSLSVRRESELAIGIRVDASVPVTRRLSVTAGVQSIQVYTSTRFRLANASAGLRWAVDTPDWLRRILD